MMKGMYAEAIAAFREKIRLGAGRSTLYIGIAIAYARAGDHQQARAILRQLLAGNEYVSPADLPNLYAALGEWDQAFALLDKAVAAHDIALIYMGNEPVNDSLRRDPRFAGILRRIGFPQ